MLGHFLRPQQRELKDLTTAADRLDHLVRLGGGEHPGHVIGRLFEGLEQGVLRLARKHVDFVEDVDLGSARVAEVDLAQQIAHVLDLVVGCGVEFVKIERPAMLNRPTTLTLTARLAIGAEILAVERLGQHSGRGGLARAPRAVEQIGVPDLGLHYCVLQRTNDMLLTADLTERLRSVATVERLIGHARPTLPSDADAVGTKGRPPPAKTGCRCCVPHAVAVSRRRTPVPGSGGQAICGTQVGPLRAAAFRP